MTRRVAVSALAVAIAVVLAGGSAATAASPPVRTTARPTHGAPSSAPKAVTHKTTAPVPAAKAEPPRTLQDIQIKGEIAVPQVLFITARDQRRFMDFQHKRYLRTSRELGEHTTLPQRIVSDPDPRGTTGKETPR
jgi:hypothetical protein